MKSVLRWLAVALGFRKTDNATIPEQESRAKSLPNDMGDRQAPSVGEVLGGRYRLDQLVGRGGAAAVYRGYDLELHHLIAVKVLLLDSIGSGITDSDFKRHLRSEALAAMRLSHPLITRVYNYDRQDPWEYLIMEFVAGQNLYALARSRPSGRLEVEETIHIGLDVLDALSYAHQQGVVHNDITPRNILVDQHDTIKVCDFGLSRLVDLQVNRLAKHVIGTAAYVSPERIRNLATDARSDLYSLGATLYAISTGNPPFGIQRSEALKGHLKAKPPRSPHLSLPFEAIIHKAMEKDPDARFGSAQEMAETLLAVLQRPLPSAQRVSDLKRNGSTSVVQQAEVVPDNAPQPEIKLPPTPQPTPATNGNETTTISLGAVEEPETSQLGKERLQAMLPAAFSSDDESTAKIKPSVAKPETSQLGKVLPRGSINDFKSPADMTWISPRKVACEGTSCDIEGFYMDRTPVTNAQYAEFLQAERELSPAWWLGTSPPKDKLDHPVVGVTITQARRYAVWRGKRLPTTLEWIAVMRGEGDRRFPWGDACNPTTCHCPLDEPKDTAPVDAHPSGTSPEGCMDLLGNVWEWTEVDARFTPAESGYYYVMGGSYRHPCKAEHGIIPQTTVGRYGEYLYLGFRCACDGVPTK